MRKTPRGSINSGTAEEKMFIRKEREGKVNFTDSGGHRGIERRDANQDARNCRSFHLILPATALAKTWVRSSAEPPGSCERNWV